MVLGLAQVLRHDLVGLRVVLERALVGGFDTQTITRTVQARRPLRRLGLYMDILFLLNAFNDYATWV